MVIRKCSVVTWLANLLYSNLENILFLAHYFFKFFSQMDIRWFKPSSHILQMKCKYLSHKLATINSEQLRSTHLQQKRSCEEVELASHQAFTGSMNRASRSFHFLVQCQVLMKCSTTEGAGQIFKTIHHMVGWPFKVVIDHPDGNLKV